jgi:hypothetical protein
MTPSITVSPGATVSPASGTSRNFASTQTYTVTAADGSTQNYTVTVNVAKNSAKAITAFYIPGYGNASISGTAISATLPYGSNTTFAPTITVSPGATVSPASGTSRNFSSTQYYTVTAEDGGTQQYSVSISVAAYVPPPKSSAKDITGFTIAGVSASISGTSITATLPYGTSLTQTPTVTVSARASYSPTGSQNFSSSRTYTVTAEDGSTRNYTVTITVAKSSAKEFTWKGVMGYQSAGTYRIVYSGSSYVYYILHPAAVAALKTANATLNAPTNHAISAGASIVDNGQYRGDYSMGIIPAGGLSDGIVTIRVKAEDGSTKDWTLIIGEDSELPRGIY